MKQIRLDHTTTNSQLTWLLAQVLGIDNIRWEPADDAWIQRITVEGAVDFEQKFDPIHDPAFILNLITTEGISTNHKWYRQWVCDLQIVEANLSAWEDRRSVALLSDDYRENPTIIRSYIRGDDVNNRGPQIAVVRCFLAAVYNDVVFVPDYLC